MMISGNLGTEKNIAENNGEVVLAEVITTDNESQAWSCTFNIPSSNIVGAGPISVEGRIKFGASGVLADSGFFMLMNSASNPITIGKEVTIPIQGSQIRLSARVLWNANPNIAIPVGAYIARNPPQKIFSPIQQVIGTGVLAAGGNVNITIPASAKTVSFFQGGAPSFNGFFSVRDGAGNDIYFTDFSPGEKLIKLPLTQGRVVNIFNASPAAGEGFLVFDIEF